MTALELRGSFSFPTFILGQRTSNLHRTCVRLSALNVKSNTEKILKIPVFRMASAKTLDLLCGPGYQSCASKHHQGLTRADPAYGSTTAAKKLI